LLRQLDAQGKLDWSQTFLDDSFVPAKRGRGVGRTKVGKGTKVMAVVEGNGLPIGLYVASAQPHELTLAQATLGTIQEPLPRSHPRTCPKEVVADRAYDSEAFRRYLRRRGIQPTIPSYQCRARKRPKRGRPLQVGPSYGSRWKVERCFAWMDNGRRLIVRYERKLHCYHAFACSLSSCGVSTIF
jgi:transposase